MSQIEKKKEGLPERFWGGLGPFLVFIQKSYKFPEMPLSLTIHGNFFCLNKKVTWLRQWKDINFKDCYYTVTDTSNSVKSKY